MRSPLISSQRFLDKSLVARKALSFKVFVVRTLEVELRGRCYMVLLDGHHNLAAAKAAGAEPAWRGPSDKTEKIIRRMGVEAFAKMLINNLTDSDWYFVESGHVVEHLLGVQA